MIPQECVQPELRVLGPEEIGMLAIDEPAAARQVETTMLQLAVPAAASWQFNGVRWLGAAEGVRTHSVSSMQNPAAMLTPGNATFSVSYNWKSRGTPPVPMVAIFELPQPIRWAGLKVLLTGSLSHWRIVSLSHWLARSHCLTIWLTQCRSTSLPDCLTSSLACCEGAS